MCDIITVYILKSMRPFCIMVAKYEYMFYNINKGGIIYGTKYTELQFFRNK